MKHALLLAALLWTALVSPLAAFENLLLKDAATPAQLWPKNGATVTVEHGRLAIRVPHGGVCNGNVPLQPEWKFIRLDMEMRTEALVPGSEGWQCGRMGLRFYDADGQPVGPWPEMFGLSGTTDWTYCARIYEIPAGAVRVAVDPSHFGRGGLVEFRDVRVTAHRTRAAANLQYDGTRLPSVDRLWDMSDAERTVNANRERITLNSIWQFMPVETAAAEQVPAPDDYPYFFKVPGMWPGYNNWKQPGSSQDIYEPSGQPAEIDGAALNHVWYRRTVDIPAHWTERRIELDLTYIQTAAQLFIDGVKAAEYFFPGGCADITDFVKPGARHEIALLVSARVDDAVAVSFNAPDRLSIVPQRIICRGITGDVYLTAEPRSMRIADVHLITSVKRGEITFDVGFKDVKPGRYRVKAEIFEGDAPVKQAASPLFDALPGQRLKFKSRWADPKLWDTDAPENLYTAVLTLEDAAGRPVDTLYPEEFGFREFEIIGRDFVLNGKPIHLRTSASCLPMAGAGDLTPEKFQTNTRLMKEFGQNHFIGLNYNFSPGETGYHDAFYRENSRYGILTTMTLPHPQNYQWKLDDPDVQKRYLELAGYIIRRNRNVPGLVMYASTHNATGYAGDQNPLRIDGVYAPDGAMKVNAQRAWHIRQQALKAAELVKRLDPTRPVYHHESGNLGPMYTINCYLNWAPSQERSDWLEHWEKHGVKPLFLMEWGLPHNPSWSSFRGPAFIWTADAVQCIWANEYNAQFLGERSYAFHKGKRELIEAQEELGKGNRPVYYGKYNFFTWWPEINEVRAIMIRDNFREMRARGLSGFLPWDQGGLWGVNRPPKRLLADRFTNLKRSGISADYDVSPCDNFGTGLFDAGKAAGEGFQPRLAWIAGKTGDFTSKNSYYLPGETVEKSLVVLNDTRQDDVVEWSWRCEATGATEQGRTAVAAGGRADIPLAFPVPAAAAGSSPRITAEFRWTDGLSTRDSFELQIGHPRQAELRSEVYLFDPEKSAAPLINALGVRYRMLTGGELPAPGTLLVVGRNALTRLPVDPGAAAHSGVWLLILEQPYDTLLNLGIRANEYGLRELLPLEPALRDKPLRNWRGSGTGVPPYLPLPDYESQMPSWSWNGFHNQRVWRAGNRGNVAVTLPEKPAIGNWLPLLHGGFDLQYAPLMEFREGDCRILFSQLEISARTAAAPEALELLASALEYLDTPVAVAERRTFYLGNDEGERTLRDLKLDFTRIGDIAPCAPGDLLIVGPAAGCGPLTTQVEAGLNLLALGLSAAEIEALLPGAVRAVTREKVYSDYVKELHDEPCFRGVSNAELHWRKPLDGAFFAADSAGGQALEAYRAGAGTAVFCQVAPWMFDPAEYQYRTTRRRVHFLVSRLAHNLGARSVSGFPERLSGDLTQREGFIDLSQGWIGKADPEQKGRELNWHLPGFRPNATWRPVKVPGMFDLQFADLKGYDGHFWYRKVFDVNHLPESRTLTLYLGAVDDESWVWLNGEFLGEVTSETNPKDFWALERIYQIDSAQLKPTGNVLVVLCNDRQMNGGILGSPSLSYPPDYRLYPDIPRSDDDPYRYYRW